MGGARSSWQREDGVNQAVPTLQTETSSHTSAMWALGVRGCVRAWNHRGILIWCTENHLRKLELETTWISQQNKALKYQILVLQLLKRFSCPKENNLQMKRMFSQQNLGFYLNVIVHSVSWDDGQSDLSVPLWGIPTFWILTPALLTPAVEHSFRMCCDVDFLPWIWWFCVPASLALCPAGF